MVVAVDRIRHGGASVIAACGCTSKTITIKVLKQKRGQVARNDIRGGATHRHILNCSHSVGTCQIRKIRHRMVITIGLPGFKIVIGFQFGFVAIGVTNLVLFQLLLAACSIPDLDFIH